MQHRNSPNTSDHASSDAAHRQRELREIHLPQNSRKEAPLQSSIRIGKENMDAAKPRLNKRRSSRELPARPRIKSKLLTLS